MNVYNYLVSLSVHDFLHLEDRYSPLLDLKYRNHEVFILLGCGALSLGEWCLMFHKSVLVSFQGAKYPHFL